MIAKITVLKEDITQMQVDAIVNAANSSLLGGGGVDGAIHRKGGPRILEECRIIRNRQGCCKTGEAVYTTAGNLYARYVIHTVGPVWNGGTTKERELLATSYRNCLKLANELQVETIAFPNISTGVYRFPKKEAAEIAVRTVQQYIEQENKTIREVFFVCFDEENYQLYQHLLSIEKK
ncbi:MAG: O-acetyl-ADP-ribose deacetylase [Tannerellaceae bacterium]|nr:O-acetyl-ADP-ribose deacetylase [Tannerellaceae bacterium]